MPREKLKYFKFHLGDFFGSEHVEKMKPEERAWYALVIVYGYRRGGWVPASIAGMAEMLGVEDACVERWWDKISACFTPVKGRPEQMTHPKMLRVYEEYERASQNGKKGNEVRWKDNEDDRSKEPPAKPKTLPPAMVPAPKAQSPMPAAAPPATASKELVELYNRAIHKYPKAARGGGKFLELAPSCLKSVKDVSDFGLAVEYYEAEMRAEASRQSRNWKEQLQYVLNIENFLYRDGVEPWREYHARAMAEPAPKAKLPDLHPDLLQPLPWREHNPFATEEEVLALWPKARKDDFIARQLADLTAEQGDQWLKYHGIKLESAA